MDCSTPGFLIFHCSLEFAQTQVHWASDSIQPFHFLLAPSPRTLNLVQHQGLFQRVVSSHQMAKYWSFGFSISPSNEYSGLISFRIDWFDLLAVLDKGMANHSSILASGTPWTVWKGRNYKGNKLFPGLEYNSTKLSNLRLNSYREHINIIFLFFFIPLEYLSSFGFICPLLFYDYFYWPKTDAKYQRSLFLVTDWQQ